MADSIGRRKFLAGSMAVMGAGFAAPAAGSSGDSDGPDVVVAENTDGRNVFFATVERTHDGELLVVYYDSPSHASRDGRISMVRSSDDGQTWSDPEVVIDTELDDRDPSIVQLRDGTLLLNFFRTDWHSDPAEIVSSFVSRSEDGGQTWSDPVRIETEMNGDSDVLDGPYQTGWAGTSDKIQELDNGDLLVPLYGTLPDDSQRRASVVRSTDGGHTWPVENESMIPDEPGWSFNEPALTQTPDGEVTIMLRAHHGDGSAYVAYSQDRGETWSMPESTDMYAHASDMLAFGNGMVFHTWGDTSGEFGPGRPVVGRVKRPQQDWTATDQKLLYDGGPGDQSYPSSVEIAPNQFFTVSYNAAQGIIAGNYSHLSDYMRPNVETAKPDRDQGLDLMGLYENGELTIDTDLTWTSPSYPTVGPLSPLDGSSNYWHSAFRGSAAPPTAHYTLEFTEPRRLEEIGLVLKPGYLESANVYFSADGENWGEPVVSFEEAVTNELVWSAVDGQDVQYVRVEIPYSDGWAILTRIELVPHPSDK